MVEGKGGMGRGGLLTVGQHKREEESYSHWLNRTRLNLVGSIPPRYQTWPIPYTRASLTKINPSSLEGAGSPNEENSFFMSHCHNYHQWPPWWAFKMGRAPQLAVFCPETSVLSVMLYGSELRLLYWGYEHKLNAFHLQSLQRTLGLSWMNRVLITTVLTPTSVTKIFTETR